MVNDTETQIIDFIAALVKTLLTRYGVNDPEAEAFKEELIFQICNDYGGRYSYVKAPTKMRRKKVLDGWARGRTIEQLAIDFDMSVRQVYNIVAGA